MAAASVSGRVIPIPVNIISDAFASLLIVLGFVGIAAGIVLNLAVFSLLGALSFIVGLVVHFVWIGKR